MKRVCCLLTVLFLAGFFSSCGAQAGEKDLLGRKVYYAGTSKELASETYSLVNTDDIYVSYLVYQNDTEKITLDSEGRLKVFDNLALEFSPMPETPSKTDEEIAELVEAYMAEKLPQEQCTVSKVTSSALGYQVILKTENASISYISASVNENGEVYWFIVYYDDTISVTKEEEAYVKELVEQNVEERYPDRKEYTCTLLYRMISQQKVAEARITVVDTDGNYVPYDLMIGID